MEFADVKKVAVIGSGDMGHGICQVAAMAGYTVAMKDVKQEFLDRGMTRIAESLDILLSKNKITEQDKEDILARISATTDTAKAVGDAQIVIEAVPEIMDLKKSVFSDVSANAPANAILATNTSTMSITEISKSVSNPRRFAGLHFFNPVNRMKLVEIIKGAETSDDTARVLVQFTEAIKKIPVVVLKDSPGFIVNRINAPNQALLSAILDEGKIKPDELDTAMKMVGMPQGPYELADYVGLDVFVHTLTYYAETLSPEFKPGKYLTAKVKAGDLGKKTGKGIYDWSTGKPVIDTSRNCQDITPMEMLAIQINEAVRVFKEGIAASVADIDLAVVHGMKAMAGPFAICSGMQPGQLTEALQKLEDRFGLAIFKAEPEVADGSFKEMK
ncbi:MAG: 3-hydroxyacyl-CoA dehydrogenase family protein [Desulfatibacillum sp.]|nr:3-hydroxyacyl-CoA dehydrogenase family protein [Desulfatibacillum sp.]